MPWCVGVITDRSSRLCRMSGGKLACSRAVAGCTMLSTALSLTSCCSGTFQCYLSAKANVNSCPQLPALCTAHLFGAISNNVNLTEQEACQLPAKGSSSSGSAAGANAGPAAEGGGIIVGYIENQVGFSLMPCLS